MRTVVWLAFSLMIIDCGASTALSQDPPDGGDGDGDGDTDADGDGDICLTHEICEDGLDNDCDGQIDEGCYDCPPGVEAPTEEICDGIDNDCDGLVDEAACPTARMCLCIPGATRWCDTPDYSLVGLQMCDEDGSGWGRCTEVSDLPETCVHVDSWYSPALVRCLIVNGFCAQDMWDHDGDGDTWESLGDCVDIACPPEGCLCRVGMSRWCDVPAYSRWGLQECRDGLVWGPCIEAVGDEIPEECRTDGWFSPWFEECALEHGLCVQDMWDHDGDGDTWESLGDCSEIVCPS